MDEIEESINWMTINNIEPTVNRIITLSNLLIKAVNYGYDNKIRDNK